MTRAEEQMKLVDLREAHDWLGDWIGEYDVSQGRWSNTRASLADLLSRYTNKARLEEFHWWDGRVSRSEIAYLDEYDAHKAHLLKECE